VLFFTLTNVVRELEKGEIERFSREMPRCGRLLLNVRQLEHSDQPKDLAVISGPSWTMLDGCGLRRTVRFGAAPNNVANQSGESDGN